MIRTKKELDMSKELLRKFQKSLAMHRESHGKTRPGSMHYLTEQGLTGQIKELKYHLKAYDALSKNQSVPLRHFVDLGMLLVAARIIKNLTQGELAKKIGMRQQQIQRYEANNYTNIAIKNLDRVVEILDINFHKIS